MRLRSVAALAALLLVLATGSVVPTGRPALSWGVTPAAATTCRDAPPLNGAGPTNQALDELGIAKVPISYMFVIDVSASMQRGGVYPKVLSALRQYLRALGPDDLVGVVIFARRAEVPVQLGRITSPQDVVDKLPETATGTKTDIGVGLAQAVAELNDAPPGSPSTVVLLTDAVHAPGDGSRFPTTAGPAWDKLAEDAAALRGTRTISAFAIPLAPNSGVDLLCSVFPGAEKLAVGTSTATLSTYLQRTQTATRLDVAKGQLAPDRGKGVAIEAPGKLNGIDVAAGGVSVTLRLHNTAVHLPAVLDGLTLASGGDLPVTAVGLPSHLELKPGQTIEQNVRLTWPVPHDSGWFSLTGRYTTTLSLSGRVSSPPADRLRELAPPDGAPLFPPAVQGAVVLSGVAPLTWSPVGILLVVLVIVAVGLLALYRWPPMNGHLAVWVKSREPGREDADDCVGKLALTGRLRRLRLAAVDPADLESAVTLLVRSRRRFGGGSALRVTVRLPQLRRSASRDIPLGARRLVLGLDLRHVMADHTQQNTAAYTTAGPPS